MKIKALVSALLGTNEFNSRSIEAKVSEEEIILRIKNSRSNTGRCPICGKQCSYYDKGSVKMRRWRALDAGYKKLYFECPSQRIDCKDHGVLQEAVAWARHKSEFTKQFEDTTCWLTVNQSKTAVSKQMRIDWHTVGNICQRVYEELKSKQAINPFENLQQIGIDETSYKKGYKYLTVVVNHVTGKVVWVGEGYGEKTLSQFFKLLTEKQRNNIKLVTADGARWITSCMQKYCPNAIRCVDPFHVVSWATSILDDIRKKLWNNAKVQLEEVPKRGKGRPRVGEVVNPEKKEASKIKNFRFALLKNPEDLTAFQQNQIDYINKTNPKLYRAYCLKEALRCAITAPANTIKEQLDAWISWAQRCRIPEFIKLREKIKRHYDAIIASAQYKVSNARVEAINNKIKLVVKMAYGYRNIENLFAMIMLSCSDVKVKLRAS